ncbi:MAG: DUF1214 domain-containing protein [Deltaproteobacteria bacterium]|jgi:hypothetical protein|nr:DUF1214 domain-containing protein [Deltaproteobacteria bacterium]
MKDDASIERILDGRAWDDFCESLKAAREALFREKSPADAFDRAEGYRYLSRLVRLGLEKFVEHNDPRKPRFFQLSREDAKIGADNPDSHYQNCCLDGRLEYRIRGHRGSVTYLGIGSYFGSYGSPSPSGCSGFIDGDELELAPDGRFEIILSARPHPGNWLPMQPETSSLIVRQFFLDRSTERPAELEIECLDAKGPPAPLDPASLDRALQDTALFVKGTADLFTSWAERFAERPNELNAPPDAVRDVAHRAASQVFYHGYWQVEPHQALLISATPPECRYWNFQLNNYWLESLDYRYHPITVNKHSAVLEEDGSFLIVVAHRDPGLGNWIDTAGHRLGTMGLRWNAAIDPPRPECRLVELAELRAGR